MKIDHFRNAITVLVCGACSASLRSYNFSCNNSSLTWQIPIVMVIWKGKSSNITLPISMKSIGVGSISSTHLTTTISHPSIASHLNTVFIIIYIPIVIIIALAPLLVVTLAFATVPTTTSTTDPTSCALLFGFLDLVLVMRMRAIWSVVFLTAQLLHGPFPLSMPCQWLYGPFHWLETFKEYK